MYLVFGRCPSVLVIFEVCKNNKLIHIIMYKKLITLEYVHTMRFLRPPAHVINSSMYRYV